MIVWRQVSPQRHILDLLDPAPYPGRYHRQSDPGTWYSSLTEHGAWAEHIRHHPAGGVSPMEVRRRIGRARAVDLVVLDLTDAKVRKQLGTRKQHLIGKDWTTCQRLASLARAAGLDGILAPSAALPGQTNLVVFASALAKLTAGSSRITHPPVALRHHRIPHRRAE